MTNNQKSKNNTASDENARKPSGVREAGPAPSQQRRRRPTDDEKECTPRGAATASSSGRTTPSSPRSSRVSSIVTVAAVDASSDGPMTSVAEKYGVSGFPTIKIVRPRAKGQKAAVIDLNTRNPSEIANLVVQAMQETIQERAGGPGGSDSGS